MKINKKKIGKYPILKIKWTTELKNVHVILLKNVCLSVDRFWYYLVESLIILLKVHTEKELILNDENIDSNNLLLNYFKFNNEIIIKIANIFLIRANNSCL